MNASQRAQVDEESQPLDSDAMKVDNEPDKSFRQSVNIWNDNLAYKDLKKDRFSSNRTLVLFYSRFASH